MTVLRAIYVTWACVTNVWQRRQAQADDGRTHVKGSRLLCESQWLKRGKLWFAWLVLRLRTSSSPAVVILSAELGQR